jgi:hypothetical protein
MAERKFIIEAICSKLILPKPFLNKLLTKHFYELSMTHLKLSPNHFQK